MMQDAYSDYEVKSSAEDVVRRFGKEKILIPDGRYRVGSIKGDMMQLYFQHAESGIRLKEKDLRDLWKKTCAVRYQMYELQRKRHNLMRIQLNAAKQLKAINDQIKKMEQKHGTKH